MSELEHKPGRFCGVLNRKHLPFGKCDEREVNAAARNLAGPALDRTFTAELACLRSLLRMSAMTT